MPKSVALVSAVHPYPVDAGKKVVLAGIIEYHRDRLGAANVHYVLVGDDVKPAEFPVPLHSLSKPATAAALGNVLTRVPTGRSSLQEALLRSASVAAEIDRTLQSLSADIEIFDTVRLAQYAGSTRTRQQVCYLDDLFSERYRAMLDAARRYPDVRISPLGNFAAHVPRALRPLADERHTQRGLMRVERSLIRRSEDRAARLFPRSLLVNQREAEHLIRRAGVDETKVQSIPPLIAEPGMHRREYGGAPEFIFLGLLSLPHNDDGLRSFLTSVWPLVLARAPGATLRVLGREPSRELRVATERFSHSVSLEGFVPDLGELFGRAAATINPLRFGSGIKLKVIEALGRGVPVVSTELGAEGITSGAAHGVLVADDPSEFADAMVGLTSIRFNDEVSQAARAHFEATYSREAVFRRYDEAFDLS